MKISVCMATYNGGKYIEEQLRSIIHQLKKDDEVIICDDLSKDNTVQLINNLKDNRIKLFINTENHGYSKNFENAITKASGEIIFIADQDDVWNSDKVKITVAALENADMIISDAEIVDKNLHQLYKSHFILNSTKKGFLNNLLKTRYIGACMAFKKEVLGKALPFPSNYSLCSYDYWLTIVAEYYFSVKLIEQPLIKYRRHGSNASSGGASSNNSFFKKIIIRIYAMIELLKRVHK